MLARATRARLQDSPETSIPVRDYIDFSDALVSLVGQFIPTSPTATDSWIERLDLQEVRLELWQVSGAVTFAGEGMPGCITIGFPRRDYARIRVNGDCLSRNSVIVTVQGRPFTFATQRATWWTWLTVPVAHPLLRTQDRSGASDVRIEVSSSILAVLRRSVSRLQWLDRIGRLESDDRCTAARQILICISSLLQTPPTTRPREIERGRPRLSRAHYLAQIFHRAQLAPIQGADVGVPLVTHQLRSALGVSERTLRNMFYDYFGVGPYDLTNLWQLQEVRKALRMADGRIHTVGSIGERLEMNLYAVQRQYRSLFGEPPSFTLYKSPRRARRRSAEVTWLEYVRLALRDGTTAN
jgi:AraC family transcriptional regulator, ethanolamine operon transcriptional activator